MSKIRNKLIKILYIYDYKGWAIYNVGKLWLNDIPHIKVTFIELKKFKMRDFDKYDLIWFGYSELFLHVYSRFYINSINFNKSIVSIHDPNEIFPEVNNWKKAKITLNKWWDIPSLHRWAKLKVLKNVKHIVSASKEMELMLHESGLNAHLISTTSSLPSKEISALKTKKCEILSVFGIYPRKNIPLMDSLQNYCKNTLKIRFDTKIGKKTLPMNRYIKLLDRHEIYICTSFQEGGPIPAMDAMRRGSVVISTPVGQIQDIITNGENGFICKTKEEFIDKISLLANDLKLLHKMRIKSLEYAIKSSNVNNIKASVLQFLDNIIETKKEDVYDKKKRISNFINYLPILILISFTSKYNYLLKRQANSPN